MKFKHLRSHIAANLKALVVGLILTSSAAHSESIRCTFKAAPRVDWRMCNKANADLRGVNLQDAILHGANFRGANLSGANLVGANLFEADLTSADLTEANLNGANLYRAKLNNANLTKTTLIRTDLTDAIWIDGRKCAPASNEGICRGVVDQSEKICSAKAAPGVDWRRCNKANADLRGANLQDAILGSVSV